MTNIKINDFISCCRCCLQFHGPFTPLFGAYLNVIFTDVTDVAIDPKDAYPQQICSRCIKKVNMAFTFKQMVLSNHKVLTEVINNVSTNHNDTENLKHHNSIEDLQNTVLEGDQLYNIEIEEKCIEDNLMPNEQEKTEDQCQPEEYDTCYKCSHCTGTFPSRPELQVHLKTHREKCVVCQKSVSVAHKSRHMLAHKKKKKCFVCDKVFSDPTNFTLHMKKHYGINSKNELCAICGKHFERRTSLHKHMRQHKNGPYSCGNCGNKYSDSYSFREHILQHVTEEKYSCDDCDATYTVKASLVKHKYRIHRIKNI